MLISHVVEGIQGDLASLGQLGGDEMAGIAERLSAAAEPALRGRVLEAVGQLVAEVNESTPGLALELRLAGDDLSVVRNEPSLEAAEPAGDRTARFALRLPEELKVLIEEQAARAGASVNSYIVRALSKDLAASEAKSNVRVGRTLRGSGHS